jgi:hypothetical protein
VRKESRPWSSQFLSRPHPPYGHYHSVKRSQRAEMKRKKAKHFLFILCCSNMTSSISFFCSKPPLDKEQWVAVWRDEKEKFFRLPFILFSSSLIYSLPHKRQGKKCRFIATLGARAPDSNVFWLPFFLRGAAIVVEIIQKLCNKKRRRKFGPFGFKLKKFSSLFSMRRRRRAKSSG